MSDLEKTQMLQPGDACEWRYPARRQWQPGVVIVNGGYGYWSVSADCDSGRRVDGLYIEHVRAPGTNPWR